MSTYWRLLCHTCTEYAEMDSIKSGDETIAMMVQLTDAILAVPGHENHDYGLHVDFTYVPIRWIVQHRGHELVARSEYGEERAIVRERTGP